MKILEFLDVLDDFEIMEMSQNDAIPHTIGCGTAIAQAVSFRS